MDIFKRRNRLGLVERRLIQICCFTAVYVSLSCLAFIWHRLTTVEEPHQGYLRLRRSTDLLEDLDAPLNCTPRSVDNFIGNFMTLEDTKNGGVSVHILIALYLIGALALICDDYFVVSLERICDDLQIEADVAGATFMAAGSSAAEFFTSLIGVFIAKSDVGVGTIVGSAVFNLLFIIGVCGLFAGVVVQLTWWPVFRDITFYLFSVLALVLVIQDGLVHWYEAMALFIMCIVYFIVLACNRRMEKVVHGLLDRVRTGCSKSRDEEDPKVPLLQEKESTSTTTVSDEMTFSTELDTRSTNSSNVTVDSNQPIEADSNQSLPNHHSPWTLPDSFPKRIFWVAMLPVKVLLYITVPDCRHPRTSFRKLYLVTFMMSVIWIAAFSYVLVWMVTIAGDALGIPDTVMGLTLLSAGTSVPDCLASLYVARDGLGDMAVSNSIASNVFNILMCLGLPWLLETAVVNTGERVPISSGGLLYDAVILLVVQLTWWPVFRDITFYLFSVLALVLVIQDGLVHWYEAMALFIMCIVYFIVLACNRRMEKVVHGLLDRVRTGCSKSRDEEDPKVPLLQEKESTSTTTVSDEMTFSTELDTRSTNSSNVTVDSNQPIEADSNQSLPNHHSPWTLPDSFPKRIFWVAMLPVKVLLYITVPDCRHPRTSFRKLYLVTFMMSVIWIAAFSYVLVWMVTIAGDALGIPDTVMGLTLLSAGTSVPDCLASLYVARDGLGDMAVSNSIASNVFNILMCLGLPWLLETAVVNTGERVPISSGGLLYDAVILLVTVAFLIIALFANRWKLNGKLGTFCIITYFIVTGVSCLFELNVFGELNLPACPR